MSERCVVVDYGSGNLHSALKSLERAASERELDVAIRISSSADDVAAADRIVLPGVGAFADCRRGLQDIPGMIEALQDVVRVRGRPFLGICVGMQLMATRGLEFGRTPGFDWISGEVKAIQPSDPTLKIPHMGWNTLDVVRPHAILAGLETGGSGCHAYFVHSFHFVPEDPGAVGAQTGYGGPVTALVARENVVGTQFHPEKSQHLGLGLLANFLAWKP